MKVRIFDKQNNFLIDIDRIGKLAAIVLLNELEYFKIINNLDIIKNNPEFYIHFTDEKSMVELNTKTFSHHYLTDVISFCYFDSTMLSAIDDILIGEIFVSADKAFESHKIFRTSFDYETVLYIVHGILHVFGYDDDTKARIAEMRKRETYYMNLLEFMFPVIYNKTGFKR